MDSLTGWITLGGKGKKGLRSRGRNVTIKKIYPTLGWGEKRKEMFEKFGKIVKKIGKNSGDGPGEGGCPFGGGRRGCV